MNTQNQEIMHLNENNQMVIEPIFNANHELQGEMVRVMNRGSSVVIAHQFWPNPQMPGADNDQGPEIPILDNISEMTEIYEEPEEPEGPEIIDLTADDEPEVIDLTGDTDDDEDSDEDSDDDSWADSVVGGPNDVWPHTDAQRALAALGAMYRVY